MSGSLSRVEDRYRVGYENFFGASPEYVKAKNARNFVLYHMVTPQKWTGPLTCIILFLELRKHFQTSGVRFLNSTHKITSWGGHFQKKFFRKVGPLFQTSTQFSFFRF
jgi:hypothetical protein